MTDVVWITRTYPWVEQPSFGFFYQTQARAVARLGTSITVACPTPWAPWPLPQLRGRWRTYANAPRRARDEAVDVVRPRYPNVPGEPSWARPDRLIAEAMWRSRADWAGAKLIHGHYSVTGLAAWRLSARSGLPFILTFHGSDMNSWPEEHPERLSDLEAAASQAGAVIAVSGALADRVKSVTGVDAIHLPLGSDHRALAGAILPRAAARERLGLPMDRLVVLFVGNLKPTKGVRELADALLAAGPPFLGVFVGDGPEYGVGLSDPRARGVLEYRGAQPHAEVMTYMSAADVLVLPSYSEGLPTVMVEAGSARLPIIASRVGGIPELLGSDRGSLLPNIDPSSIEAALHAFVADRDAATKAAERLHGFVLERYDVDRNAERLVAIYRDVAPALGGQRVAVGPGA